MGSQAMSPSFSLSSLSCHSYLTSSSSRFLSLKPSLQPLKHLNSFNYHPHIPSLTSAKSFKSRTRATLDEKEKNPSLIQEQQPNQEVEKSVKVLKNAAKTRKVPAEEVLSAFSVIEKAKIDPSAFLETLGGLDSPGRTWMLIFTAEKKLKGGRYFPLTAVQRFDAAENFHGRTEYYPLFSNESGLKLDLSTLWRSVLARKMIENQTPKILSLSGFTLTRKSRLLEAEAEEPRFGAGVLVSLLD
ncbi:hypothetical protein E1A91_D12G303900v1 [Gossypium mustelinum]|uniref:Uncharacterized protein n=1 Tax=Gossypium mustelinum TaxID=34275 RepID=A0A5D2SKY0_GOSMU|nr:hypothetical protein E1A91_D12G303900v1 [Gossypium mustelinum]